MMPLAARVYVSLDVSGNDLADHLRLGELQKAYEAHMAGRHNGFGATRFESAEDMEDEMVNSTVVLKASKGRLPLFYVNFTFRSEEVQPGELAELERRFALDLITEHVEPERTP